MYDEIFNSARDFGRYGIITDKKKLWIVRIFIVLFVIVCLCRLCGLFGSALTVSTYNDILGNNSVCNNLLSFVPCNMKYVIFQDSSDSYYCFYGKNSDFIINNNNISASDLNYIRYYRSGSYSTYSYSSGSANLNLMVNNIITSNLNTDFLSSENNNYKNMSIQYIILISVLVFFPCLMILNTRRLSRVYY